MRFRVTVDGVSYDVEVEPLPDGADAPTGDAGAVTAPIAGTVMEVLVKPGDAVHVNEPLMVIEALKVESNVVSPYEGVVGSIAVTSGQRVKAGDVLLRF